MAERDRSIEAVVGVSEQSPLESLLSLPVAKRPAVPDGYEQLPDGMYQIRVNPEYLTGYESYPLVVIGEGEQEIQCDDVIIDGRTEFACEAGESRSCGFSGSRGKVRVRVSRGSSQVYVLRH